MTTDSTHHDGVPAPPPPQTLRPGRSSRLLFESVLIVGSVALGFLVTEWRERAADRDLSHRILTNVVAEIRANREWVSGQIVAHNELIARFRSAPPATPDQSGWDAITATLKAGPGVLPLRRAAWDAAVSSGALRLIDYDIAARLSEIYAFQDEGYGRASRSIGEALFVPDTFKPGTAREIARMFQTMLTEIVGQETYVLELYDRHLPALQAQVSLTTQ